jgi:hypothetical protein
MLKPFTRQDWYGYAGACKLADGREPLIAHVGPYAIIVSGDDASNSQTLVEVTVTSEDGEMRFSRRIFKPVYYSQEFHKGVDAAEKYGNFLAANPELIESLETFELA